MRSLRVVGGGVPVGRRETTGHRGAIWQLKDLFGPALHRAKTLGGLLAWLAAKVAAYSCV
jgi:hypothetical protein